MGGRTGWFGIILDEKFIFVPTWYIMLTSAVFFIYQLYRFTDYRD